MDAVRPDPARGGDRIRRTLIDARRRFRNRMTQSNAYLNRIATAVPDYEVNEFYLRFGASLLADHPQRLSVFRRMTDLSGIERRYSCFAPADDPQGGAIDRDGTSV